MFPRGASSPDADHTFTTAECGGEPPPGTARYSRREWRFPYIKKRKLGGTVEYLYASSLGTVRDEAFFIWRQLP